MSKKKFDQQLAELEALRTAPRSPETAAALRKALGNRSNFVAAKAAKVVGEQGFAELIGDLLVALERFFTEPEKTDPQCWAKTAIFRALSELGHDDADVFLRGLRYVQMEAVWGGREDMAGGVRAQCAAALVGCRSIPDAVLLRHLVDLLADADKSVRVEAARAVGRIPRAESALLLRLRILVGDSEPEVLAVCFKGVLDIEGAGGVDFASRFLDGGGEPAEEAALALGECREEGAFSALKAAWERGRHASLRNVLLSAMALTREREALDYLAGIVRRGPLDAAQAAVRAVVSARFPAELRDAFAVAVQERGLTAAWQLPETLE